MFRTRLDATDDSGFTLTEVLVAMGLLTIFMTIFTTVTLMMTNTTTKVQRISGAVTQANQAFIALDKTIRYASALSAPAQSTAGTWHVEFDTSKVKSDGTGYDVCTQLRIDNTKRQLQQRTWTVSATSYASGTLSVWKPLVDNVRNGTVSSATPASGVVDDRPFWTPAATTGATSNFQRLRVTIVAAGDAVTTTDTNRASMTFAAVNSAVGGTSSVCQQVAVDSTS